MDCKLFDSELRVMNVLWEQVQGYETDILVDKLFGGSTDLLFASLLDRKKLTREELDRLRALVEEAQK